MVTSFSTVHVQYSTWRTKNLQSKTKEHSDDATVNVKH